MSAALLRVDRVEAALPATYARVRVVASDARGTLTFVDDHAAGWQVGDSVEVTFTKVDA